MSKNLQKLFEPINIGKLELKNRILMEPMGGLGLTINDRVTDRFNAFFNARARGGAGLIVIRIAPLTDLGHPGSIGPGLYRDDFIPGLKEFVSIIHEGGAKVAAQIGIDHTWCREEGCTPELIAPSPVALPGLPTPRELTTTEIQRIVSQFGDGARRAREAGFDAVELHAFGSFLLAKFLSPYTNKRHDAYGGTSENRLRIFLEIIKNIKEKAGADYTLACRIIGGDFMEGGLTLEEVKVYAAMLENAGIQLLDVGVGFAESGVPFFPMSVPRGAYVYLAEDVKKVIHIPVVAGTRINNPLLAEQVLAEGRADLIGLGRALVADPEFPNKTREGEFDAIRPCIACCHCFDTAVMQKLPMACAVNPRVGREAEYALKPAAKAKKIFIIGGGPAGMLAAAVASERGHKITLWESKDRLGGKLLVAAVPPYKDEISQFTTYLIGQIKKQNVEVKLGKEFPIDSKQENKPVSVIIATGSYPVIPDIPGITGSNVFTAVAVLNGTKHAGKRVIIIGGGLVGCETAEFLVEKGCEVTILEKLGRIGNDIGPTTRWVILRRLRMSGIKMETKVDVTEITERGIKAIREGVASFLECDSVIIAAGFKSDTSLADRLRGQIKELYVIGDCNNHGRIAEATEDAVRIATKI